MTKTLVIRFCDSSLQRCSGVTSNICCCRSWIFGRSCLLELFSSICIETSSASILSFHGNGIAWEKGRLLDAMLLFKRHFAKVEQCQDRTGSPPTGTEQNVVLMGRPFNISAWHPFTYNVYRFIFIFCFPCNCDFSNNMFQATFSLSIANLPDANDRKPFQENRWKNIFLFFLFENTFLCQKLVFHLVFSQTFYHTRGRKITSHPLIPSIVFNDNTSASSVTLRI